MLLSTSTFSSSYTCSTHRGKHKIFVGMAPGVGKTYKMLEEAHRLKRSGIDVVIGFLEAHDRWETTARAEGLEVISCQAVVRSGETFKELDVNAVIDRQPQLVLIDELAHTNLGTERERRYQDVEAILAAGIHVYSTVNIQHFESMSDRVAQITGIAAREIIPEIFLETADEIVVVDTTPEALEERLRNGKIYPAKNVDESLKSCFQHCKLVALRRLALREVADRVEEKRLQEAIQRCGAHDTPDQLICGVHEKILVCVSTQPNSLQLIRRGARLALYKNALLYVLSVSHPDSPLTQKEIRYIQSCQQLCQKLGGEFLQTTGCDPVEEITKAANSHQITEVIIGQTGRSRWQIFLQGSLTSRLVRSLKQTDIHIVSSGT